MLKLKPSWSGIFCLGIKKIKNLLCYDRKESVFVLSKRGFYPCTHMGGGEGIQPVFEEEYSVTSTKRPEKYTTPTPLPSSFFMLHADDQRSTVQQPFKVIFYSLLEIKKMLTGSG
jgi:hypothetical protein